MPESMQPSRTALKVPDPPAEMMVRAPFLTSLAAVFRAPAWLSSTLRETFSLPSSSNRGTILPTFPQSLMDPEMVVAMTSMGSVSITLPLLPHPLNEVLSQCP